MMYRIPRETVIEVYDSIQNLREDLEEIGDEEGLYLFERHLGWVIRELIGEQEEEE